MKRLNRYWKSLLIVIFTLTLVLPTISGCMKVETLVATPSPTMKPIPSSTPTIPNTPTATATVPPTPDFDRLSQAYLIPPDFPPGFGMGPTSQLRSYLEDFSTEGLSIEAVYYLENRDAGYYISGGTYALPDVDAQSAFETMLDTPNAILDGFLSLGWYSPIIEQGEITQRIEIGDASKGHFVRYGTTSTELRRMDLLIFQSGYAGAVLMLHYPEGTEPLVTIDELARILETRINDLLFPGD